MEGRKAKNSIRAIANDEGVLLTRVSDAKQEFIHYFKRLLGSPSSSCASVAEINHIVEKQIDNDSLQALLAPITKEEIKSTLFSLSPNKSPGPYGFSSHFYVVSWEIVGDDVTRAIKPFLIQANSLKR